MVSTIYFYGSGSTGKTTTIEKIKEQYPFHHTPISDSNVGISVVIKFPNREVVINETNVQPETNDLVVEFHQPDENDDRYVTIDDIQMKQEDLISFLSSM